MRDRAFTITFDTAARQLGFTSDRALFKRLCELHVLKDAHTVAHHYKCQGLFYNSYSEYTPPGYSKAIYRTRLVISKKGMEFLHTLLGIPNDNTNQPTSVGTPDRAGSNARAETATL